MSKDLFDNSCLTQRQSRFDLCFHESSFLFEAVLSQIKERLMLLRRTFTSILIFVDGHRDMSLKKLMREIYPDARLIIHSPYESWDCSDVDLIVSDPLLHWLNDLPSFIHQCRQALLPDGFFLGTLFGGKTLTELRDSFLKAELAVEGGATPRVIPMAHLYDMAHLMQKAGFALPVVDREEIIVKYTSPIGLLKDLRHMGEANRLHSRRKYFSRRDTINKMVAYYMQNHQDGDSKICATFEIHTLSGWSPDISQQKPLKRGSAKSSLKRMLEGLE